MAFIAFMLMVTANEPPSWAEFGQAFLFLAGMLVFSEFMLWGVGMIALDDALKPVDLRDEADEGCSSSS